MIILDFKKNQYLFCMNILDFHKMNIFWISILVILVHVFLKQLDINWKNIVC